MDAKKQNNNKSNFFKKEGFYVILFICLCVVAGAAAVVTQSQRHAKKPVAQAKTQQKIVEKDEPVNIAEEPLLQRESHDNALQVKNGADKKTAVVEKNENTSAAVSKPVDNKFIKPVEGVVARSYSEDPVFWDSTNSYRSNWGIDIKTQVGKPVLSVLDGKVEAINSVTQDGVEVVINHQNGLKTIYANLDGKVSVTKGQMVKKGDQIGTVGKTTIRAAYEKYGDHLHFAVNNGKDFVDPAKYIKY